MWNRMIWKVLKRVLCPQSSTDRHENDCGWKTNVSERLLNTFWAQSDAHSTHSNHFMTLCFTKCVTVLQTCWFKYVQMCSPDAWWRHQMETFPALQALCAGNSPVTDEFPSERPATRSFDIFFGLRLIKRLSKQSCGWWFETPSHPWWRHCNGCFRDGDRNHSFVVMTRSLWTLCHLILRYSGHLYTTYTSITKNDCIELNAVALIFIKSMTTSGYQFWDIWCSRHFGVCVYYSWDILHSPTYY